jgi:hypothetical protein
MSLKRGRGATRPDHRIPARISVRAAGRHAVLQELAQHVVENAAVAVVVDLVEGADPAGRADSVGAAVGASTIQGLLARCGPLTGSMRACDSWTSTASPWRRATESDGRRDRASKSLTVIR